MAGGDVIFGLPLRLEVGPFWKTKDILEYKNLPIGSPYIVFILLPGIVEFIPEEMELLANKLTKQA